MRVSGRAEGSSPSESIGCYVARLRAEPRTCIRHNRENLAFFSTDVYSEGGAAAVPRGSSMTEQIEATMKMEPRYGYYPWWPEDGDDWLHPEDVELAREWIPSPRVFRREGEQGEFVVLHYGDQQLRVRRTLWQEVRGEGFEIGDWVEVLSRGHRNTPRTGIIRERLYDTHDRCLLYQIWENDQPIPKRYRAEDLRHVEPTQAKRDD